MSILLKTELLKLSVPERIQLAEDIWDTIAVAADEMDPTDQQRTELDHRLQEYEKNPNAGSSWVEVKKRIRSRK